jgi:hypothetical protein
MKKILILLTFISSFFFSPLQAMNKMKSGEEEPYQLSKQEKKLESYRYFDWVCPYCLYSGYPKIGVPLIGKEKKLRRTHYYHKLRKMTAQEKAVELQKLLEKSSDSEWWWDTRTHIAIALIANVSSNKILHKAVAYSDYMLVDLLLHYGADPDAIRFDSSFTLRTPLFNASNKQMAQLLVKYGANIYHRDCFGSLLHNSIWNNHPIDLIQYYLAQGLKVDSQNHRRNTVLHCIALHNNNTKRLQLSEIVLYATTSLDKKNEDGETAENILHRRLQEDGECQKKHLTSKDMKACYQCTNEMILAMIHRTQLSQKWRIFARGWIYAFKNEPTSLLSWLPSELIVLIKEFVKLLPYKLGAKNNI